MGSVTVETAGKQDSCRPPPNPPSISPTNGAGRNWLRGRGDKAPPDNAPVSRRHGNRADVSGRVLKAGFVNVPHGLWFSSLAAESEDLDPEVTPVALLGFTGCLSVVRFNSISPLKAALLHRDTSPVQVSGPLARSGCGSSAPADPSAAEDAPYLPGRSRLEQTAVCWQGSSG